MSGKSVTVGARIPTGTTSVVGVVRVGMAQGGTQNSANRPVSLWSDFLITTSHDITCHGLDVSLLPPLL